VIARVWCATATPANAPKYAEHLGTHVIPVLRQLKGYVDACLWQRPAGDLVELVVVTRWRSLESISDFAGEDIERAVVADEAAAVLVRYDDRVRHYEVVEDDSANL
jgi:heme-degrading monooxygenase HmoA